MLPCSLLRLAPSAPRRRALSPSLPQRVVCTGCRLSYAGEGAALSPRCLGHAQVSDGHGAQRCRCHGLSPSLEHERVQKAVRGKGFSYWPAG